PLSAADHHVEADREAPLLFVFVLGVLVLVLRPFGVLGRFGVLGPRRLVLVAPFAVAPFRRPLGLLFFLLLLVGLDRLGEGRSRKNHRRAKKPAADVAPHRKTSPSWQAQA